MVDAGDSPGYHRSVIRRAEGSEAGEIARIVNAAFEVEREFRKGDRTSAAENL
jgi:hypothetical protein